MLDLYQMTALILLATVTVGLVRIFVGTERVERLLALQLLGTTTVAIVLLLALSLQQPVLADIALVLGLLASTIAIAYVRYGTMKTSSDSPRHKP